MLWALVVMSLAVTVTVAVADELSESDQYQLELSTFYNDCEVFANPNIFNGPICGCDGKTYHNCVYMACMNYWRQPQERVQMVSQGPCEPCKDCDNWSPVYSPVCGKNNLTYANVEALLTYNEKTGEEMTVQYDGECIDPDANCMGVDPTPWEDSVCATNGRTYPSVTAIADMRKFGQCLDVLHDGGCTMEEVKERCPSREDLCNMARNTYEWNPQCGNDGVTYANPYMMTCYRPNVKVSYPGECESEMHQACQAAVAIDTGEAHSPSSVCASDGLTYTSVHHLECAKNNDKNLYFRHNGPCKAPDNPCAYMAELKDCGEPVCGSDGVTYVSPNALWCMQRKEDPFLRYFHDGPCFRRCIECSCNLGWSDE